MNSHKEPTKLPAKTRRKRLTDSVVIQITTTQSMCVFLDRIVKTGFFGGTRAAAAERLLSESLRGVLKEGVIQRRQKLLEEKE